MGLPAFTRIIRTVRGAINDVRRGINMIIDNALQHPWVRWARSKWPLSRKATLILIALLLGISLIAVGGYVLAGPAVYAAGFQTGGVVAGSLAAGIHSSIGTVAAGSVFAGLQAWGATMAVPTIAGVIGGFALVGTGAGLTGWGVFKCFQKEKD
ncbi:hypothetical protein FA15DRAFT_665380 [Coprinopsis marcescibilis]|uniref:Uncharacterized protein n=1 Tax=Coprinopsis marcescibilis TaxID=230819 RepID=A0A5C3LIN1_COPMA|nr:hypothetical protein FA15DRAFT_665380 [Coprinopsis marcescibilis]